MILLLVILFFLLCALYHLLTHSSPKPKPVTTPRLSHLQKLLAEAFEHAPALPSPRVLIVYGTEYGFAKEVAHKLAARLSTSLLCPRVVSALHFRALRLAQERYCLFICSTTGDGAVPNEAADLHEALRNDTYHVPHALRLAVLALGDRAYPNFCSAGKLFETLFRAGAWIPRVDVDQEDWVVIDAWVEQVETAVKKDLESKEGRAWAEDVGTDEYLEATFATYARELDLGGQQRYTRNEPYAAELVAVRELTMGRSGAPDDKEVVRMEFDLGDSGLVYEVGDALGVVPRNNSEHVMHVLRGLAANGDEPVLIGEGGGAVPFEDALMDHFDISAVKPELVAMLAARVPEKREQALGERVVGHEAGDGVGAGLSDLGKEYLAERKVVDVLEDFASATVRPQELVDALRPLHARYYSISSRPGGGRVAITVDVLRYKTLNMEREGVASTFLRDRCKVGKSKVGLFVSKNPNFRLPKEKERPVVMIGPGTGIAPFMAFLEERLESEATGSNWLFFGCRHKAQDFLYRKELERYAASGKLRLETAFSRDKPSKVYVQHRMAECAEELWGLIDGARAHVYVCGDGGKMAEDVDMELVKIVEDQGGMGRAEAREYVTGLSEAQRYQRDVWVS